MTIDEKYLFALNHLPPRKIIKWTKFLSSIKDYSFKNTPENIFLLLYKKGWISVHAYQPSIDRLKEDMSLGLSPSFNHVYFSMTELGIERLESLKAGELLKINDLYKQLKLKL